MKVLLICKEMIAYERTAIMLLASNLKSKNHQVQASVMRDPVVDKKLKKKLSKKKSLSHSDAYEGKPFTFTESAQSINTDNTTERFNNIFNTVKSFKPDLIGYSVMTGEHYDVIELNKRLKKDFN